MRVEVCHATSAAATRIAVDLPAGGTVADAIERSKILALLQLASADLDYAVFGRRARPTTELTEGDRVELLRPLQVDPMEARRRRVAKRSG